MGRQAGDGSLAFLIYLNSWKPDFLSLEIRYGVAPKGFPRRML